MLAKQQVDTSKEGIMQDKVAVNGAFYIIMPNLLCIPRHFSAMTATTRPRASLCGEPGLLHSPAASNLLPMLQHRQEAHSRSQDQVHI